MDHFGWRGRGHIGPTLDHIGPDEIRFKNPSFFSRPASKSNGSSRTGVEGAGPLANERRRRNCQDLRYATLDPTLDQVQPFQNWPWTTLALHRMGDLGPRWATLDRPWTAWSKVGPSRNGSTVTGVSVRSLRNIAPDSHAVCGGPQSHAVTGRISGQQGRAHGAEGGGLVTRRYARAEPAEAAMAA